jgi:hypothetical protein
LILRHMVLLLSQGGAGAFFPGRSAGSKSYISRLILS